MPDDTYTFKVRRIPFPGAFDYEKEPSIATVSIAARGRESNGRLNNVYVLKHIAFSLMNGDIEITEVFVINSYARGENWFFSRIEMDRDRDTIDKLPIAECIKIAKTTKDVNGYPPTNIALLARAIYSLYLAKTGPKGRLRHEYLKAILEWMLYLVDEYIEEQVKKYA